MVEEFKITDFNNQDTKIRKKNEDDILYQLRRYNVDDMIEKGDKYLNYFIQNYHNELTEELKKILKEARTLYKEAYFNIIQAGIPNEKVDYDKKLSGNNFFLEEEFYRFHNKENEKDLEYEIKCLSKLVIIYDKLHPDKDKEIFQQKKLIESSQNIIESINKLKIDIIEKIKNQDWYKDMETIKIKCENNINKFINEEADTEVKSFMKKYCVEKKEDIIPFIKDFIYREYFPKDKIKIMEEYIEKKSIKDCYGKLVDIYSNYAKTDNKMIKGKDHIIKQIIRSKINGFKGLIKEKKVHKNYI